MGNYFSSAPVDFGADQIARGYSGLANSISNIGGYFADQNKLKLQASIEEQKRQTDLERQITMSAAQYGVDPIIDPATNKINVYATAAATKKAADMHERLKQLTGMQDESDFQSTAKAKALGIGGPPVPAGMGGVGGSPSTNIPTSFGMDPGVGGPSQAPQAYASPESRTQGQDLERQIYLKEQENKNAEYEKQRKISADSELQRQRAGNDAKEIDSFRSAFGREPAGTDLDANGRLSANALGAIATAKNNAIKGFTNDPSVPGGLTPVPGGPADIKMKADQQKLEEAKATQLAKKQAAADTRANVLDNIKAAIPQIGMTTAGVIGGRTTGFNQSANDLHANLEAIKSGLGVDMLNEMRASSTSGSTGIGRIMQIEFEAFSKAARNLDQKQSPKQLKANLQELQTHLENWDALHNAATQEPSKPAAAPAGPSIDDRLKKYLK